MPIWISKITPIGLLAVGLILLCQFFISRKKQENWHSVAYFIATMVCFCLAGLIWYGSHLTDQRTRTIHQTSTGDGSPNVQTDGSVTMTIDQSKQKTEIPQPPTSPSPAPVHR